MRLVLESLGRLRAREHVGLPIALCAYVCISIWSLNGTLAYGGFYLSYDPRLVAFALMSVGGFAPLLALFAVAPFSFGYFLSFYLYNVAFGYLWLSWFTDFGYNQSEARLSTAVSLIVFALPALFLSIELPAYRLSHRAFERLLSILLVIGAGIVLWAATYSFRLITLSEMDAARKALAIPSQLSYALGAFGSSILPFVFACFVILGFYWRACAVILLLMLFFPITLNKTAFFSPLWLLALAILSSVADARLTTVLSRLLPALIGVVLIAVFHERAQLYFFVVNFRMLAIPSSALNLYHDFFSTHEVTHFCHISVLKSLFGCAYADQLGVLMLNVYKIATFNASLLASEGVASVGTLLAPVTVFACGILVALVNALARGLPHSLVLLSSALLVQALTDVPLSTGLLTHGGAILFVLWYLTPRSIFAKAEARLEAND